ncbi:hepatocyte cell adhesion molecule isoform X2 [Cheilinus undulatus]|uniref:hepatocyte cell adhesion molecule isoform X2 n=1 Tax=Cheilinus undulatus TaxID=241271 RepID=UPI001BD477A7|nr:hepatocyte cell adhesion molecule isoform X2 [Cheilinus undulatus]
MGAVLGLLLLLLGVSHGVKTHCDGRQNGAVCFGPLGGTVVFRLMDDASKIFRYAWKKGETNILQGREEKVITNQITNRSSFTPSNGTFRINDLSRNDDGEYTLELFFDSSGSNKAKQTLQLNIQVPVSSVRLTSECLSEGEKRVSCSSQEGDSPRYSWTLNGRTLSNSQLLSGNSESQTITLKQDQSGRLACTVRNQVTSVTKEEQISTCGFQFFDCTLLNGTYITKWLLPTNETQCIQSTTLSGANLPTVLGVLCALLILLVVGVAVICAQKKKKNKAEDDNEDQDLTYADVKIVQQRREGRPMQQMAEPEVEYGQVKFSQRPRQTVEPPREESVYAMVRKGR